MFVSFILILILTILVNGLFLPKAKLQINNSTAEEIQHAICKITSKDLEATANATIFRELKGVCTSDELQTYLNRLELKLLQEMDNIKNILKQNGFKMPIEKEIRKTIEQSNLEETPVPKKLSNELEFRKTDEKPIVLNYKDFSENIILKDITVPREQEILEYNDTIIDSTRGSIYLYYWNIHNIQELLAKQEMYKSSPEFFVMGHDLHLQLYPNYGNDQSFAIHLGASTKGFIKKHKIYILNQSDKNLDIESDLILGFKGEESMFKVSEDITHEYGFISNNKMIVKLEILLNS